MSPEEKEKEVWEIRIGFKNNPFDQRAMVKGTKEDMNNLYTKIKSPHTEYDISHSDGSKTLLLMKDVAIVMLNKVIIPTPTISKPTNK